ncbi:MAG: cyanophycinase [Bacteroidota bacterium]|nr:cyanophycinase [Bacteroidota bacterium]
MIPKGKLIIIGGHEDKGTSGESLEVIKREDSSPHPHFEILSELISKIPRSHHIIEIIATASAIPQEMEETYRAAYKNVGFTKVDFIRIENEKEANDILYIKRIEYCHAVFFTGGDQTRLTSTLNDSKVLNAIKRKYIADEHFIVAGTSAGAMAIPQTIIAGGIIREALMKDDIRMGDGFSFIDDIIVDTHFIKRGRIARLAHAVALNSTLLGIGLGEDTALTISNGNEAICTGSGMVIIIDGNTIGKTNIKTVDDKTPIIIENLKVHILAEGSTFLIIERKML